MNNPVSSLQFNGYNILNFNFTMNPDAIKKNSREVGIGFDYSYNEKDESHFSILLTCYINDKKTLPIKKADEDIPFSLVLTVEGSFTVNETSNKYLPNAIAILFPYLRSFISTVTAQSGMPPFILPTYNILALLKEDNSEMCTDPTGNTKTEQ
ncbi:MAG: hypothetical protein ACFWUC_13105 [Oscillospiraceae bacterium]|jgi:preprotein translocase subunit SecB